LKVQLKRPRPSGDGSTSAGMHMWWSSRIKKKDIQKRHLSHTLSPHLFWYVLTLFFILYTHPLNHIVTILSKKIPPYYQRNFGNYEISSYVRLLTLYLLGIILQENLASNGNVDIIYQKINFKKYQIRKRATPKSIIQKIPSPQNLSEVDKKKPKVNFWEIRRKFDKNSTKILQKNLYRIKTVYLTNKDSTKRLRTHYHFSKKVQ